MIKLLGYAILAILGILILANPVRAGHFVHNLVPELAALARMLAAKFVTFAQSAAK